MPGAFLEHLRWLDMLEKWFPLEKMVPITRLASSFLVFLYVYLFTILLAHFTHLLHNS